MINVGIVGANGYTGLELMKILACHPEATLKIAVSRSNAGTLISDMYPVLKPFSKDLKFVELVEEQIASECDVVFTALPHAASAEIGGKLFNMGVKVIDLSADFRYDDLNVYEKTYKVVHPCPTLNEKAVYGLCELNREKIKNACIVGNPGCYTSCAILPLYPLVKEGLIDADGIIIDAASGSSGAGKKADTAYTLTESVENFKAYGVTTHRHTSEIEEKLSIACLEHASGINSAGKKTIGELGNAKKLAVTFTPHLLPVKRGILETIYAKTTATKEQIAAAFEKYYKDEPFVSVLAEGVLPELNWVARSNMCYIGYKMDARCNQVIIVSAIDNLVKGASGQAVQNMNIMFGLDETLGLPKVGSYL